MTAEEVRALVLREIANRWDRSNAHGVNLRECLLATPETRTYTCVGEAGAKNLVELWLVLEEDPAEHSGYEIVFDEVRHAFGLATQSTEGPVYLGIYGSFLDALEAM